MRKYLLILISCLIIFVFSAIIATFDSLANREVHCNANRIFSQEKLILGEIYRIFMNDGKISKKTLFLKLERKFPNLQKNYCFNQNYNLFYQGFKDYISAEDQIKDSNLTAKNKIALYRQIKISSKFSGFFLKNQKIKYVGITFNFSRQNFQKKPEYIQLK